MLRIFKARIPSELLKKLERDHIDHVLVDLLIADLGVQSLHLDDRHAIGRTDSALYVNHLPGVLQPYVGNVNNVTISSSVLLQRAFADEFRENIGWVTAKILYVNAMFKEQLPGDSQTNSQAESLLGENDPAIKDASRKQLKGLAEAIAQSIFGHPVEIKNSPLPRRLIDTLIYADQRFHEQLLTGQATKDWSTEQIRDARCSLIKLLTVTRLLMPMLIGTEKKNPSQKQIWCLGLSMQMLQKSAMALSKDILVTSFVTSSASLQRLAGDKEKQERTQQRTKAFKSRSKKPGGHGRSRSADTTPVNIDWLARRDEIRAKRALEKKEGAIEKTKSILSSVGLDDDIFEKTMDDAGRALKETDELRQAIVDIGDFDLEDIKAIEQMLIEQNNASPMTLHPEGTLTPERPQSLPTSTADPLPNMSPDEHDGQGFQQTDPRFT